MTATEETYNPDHDEAGEASPSSRMHSADPAPVRKGARLWLAILLRVLGILAIIYFVPA